MVVDSPLIRPAISWGKRGIGGCPLGSRILELGSSESRLVGDVVFGGK